MPSMIRQPGGHVGEGYPRGTRAKWPKQPAGTYLWLSPRPLGQILHGLRVIVGLANLEAPPGEPSSSKKSALFCVKPLHWSGTSSS